MSICLYTGWSAQHPQAPAKFQTADHAAQQTAIDEPVTEATTAATVAPPREAEPPSANDTTAPAGGGAATAGEPGATGGKRMGLVSAAIRVLEDAGGEAAMNCHELVKQATERGLWQPRTGKTPASTLYAAILREINEKGESSRFRKVARGRFALNKLS